jgi:hypothetical protein
VNGFMRQMNVKHEKASLLSVFRPPLAVKAESQAGSRPFAKGVVADKHLISRNGPEPILDSDVDSSTRLRGSAAMNVVTQLSAFLLTCIGLQIAWNGISALIHTL